MHFENAKSEFMQAARDRPDSLEIEITPAMVEAGARKLCEIEAKYGWTDGWLTIASARQVAAELIRAALCQPCSEGRLSGVV